MIDMVCPVCQKEFKTFPRTLRRVKTPTCSKRCNGSNRYQTLRHHSYRSPKGFLPPAAGLKGEKNYAWKGGVTFKRNKGNYIGPKYVRCPLEFLPMARKDGYVMEHRLIVAKRLGRCLLRTEVVHHKDHVTRNNQDENLELFASNGEHKREEARRLRLASAAAA